MSDSEGVPTAESAPVTESAATAPAVTAQVATAQAATAQAAAAQAVTAQAVPTPASGDRVLDTAALKALAHPLRVQIFDALSIYGNFTASGLAERLGESSGSTSYHLRQLEKHGLVREVEGKGTSRERWWERPPGAVTLGSSAATETPAGRSASTMIFRELRHNEEVLLNEYVERGEDELTAEWHDAGVISTMNARLTAEQLATLTKEVMAVTDKFLKAYKGQKVVGARPVHVVFQAFPIIDGDAMTEADVAGV